MLTLKALEEGSRSSEARLVHHLLLCSIKTLSILEGQLIKLRDANKLACYVIVIE